MDLRDNYLKNGEELKEAVEAVNEIKKNTVIKKVKMQNIIFYDVVDAYGFSKQVLVRLNPVKVYKTNRNSFSIKSVNYNREDFTKIGWMPDEMAEIEKEGMFIKIGKTMYPVSRLAYQSIANRAGISGPAASQRSLCRSMFVADNFNSEKEVSVIIRKDGKKEKIFAIMSGDYGYIRQDLISDIIQKCQIDYYGLGKPECETWSVSQSFTRIFINFPEKKSEFELSTGEKHEYIPGIMLETSDTGECAFRIVSYMNVNGYKIFTPDKYEKKHYGEMNPGKLMDYIQDSIFPKLTIYPEKYEKLSDTAVYIPFATKQETGLEIFHDMLKYCELTRIIGKKRIKNADEELKTQFAKYAAQYKTFTAYDLMIFVMGLTKKEGYESPTIRQNIAEYMHRILNWKPEKK